MRAVTSRLDSLRAKKRAIEAVKKKSRGEENDSRRSSTNRGPMTPDRDASSSSSSSRISAIKQQRQSNLEASQKKIRSIQDHAEPGTQGLPYKAKAEPKAQDMSNAGDVEKVSVKPSSELERANRRIAELTRILNSLEKQMESQSSMPMGDSDDESSREGDDEALRQLHEKNKEQLATIQELSDKLKQLENEKEQVEKEVDRALDTAGDAKRQLADTSIRLQELEEVLGEGATASTVVALKDQIATLQKEKEELLSSQRAKASDDARQLGEDLQDSRSRIEAALESIPVGIDGETDPQREKLVSDLSESKEKLTQALHRIEDLEDALYMANAAIQAQVLSDSENNPKQMDTSLAELEDATKKIEDLQHELDVANEAIMQQVEKDLDHSDNLVSQMELQEAELATVRKELDQVQAEYESTQKQLSHAMAELDDLRPMADKIELLLTEMDQSEEKLRKELEQKDKEAAESKEALRLLQATTSSASIPAVDRTVDSEAAEELELTKEALSETQQALVSANLELRDLRPLADKMERLLEEMDASELELRNHIKKLEDELALSRKDLRAFQEGRDVPGAIPASDVGDDVESLRKELDDAEENLGAVRKQLDEATAELQTLRPLSKKGENLELDSGRNEQELKKKVLEKEKDVEVARNELKTILTRIVRINSALGSEGTTQDDDSTWETMLTSVRVQLDEAEKSAVLAKQELDKVNSTVTASPQEMEHTMEQLRNHEFQIKNLLEERDALIEEVTTLRTESQTSRSIPLPSVDTEEIDRLTNNIKGLEETNSMANARVEKLETERDDALKKIDEMEADLAEKQKKLEWASQEITQLKETQENIVFADAREDEVETEKAKLQEKIDDSKKKVEEMKALLNEKDHISKQKEAEIAALEEKISSLQDNLSAIGDEKYFALQQRDNAERSREYWQDRVAEIEKSLSNQIEQYIKLEDKLKDIEEENQRLKENVLPEGNSEAQPVSRDRGDVFVDAEPSTEAAEEREASRELARTLQEELFKHQENLEDAFAVCNTLVAKNEELKAENDKLRAERDEAMHAQSLLESAGDGRFELLEKIEDLKREVANLNDELDAARASGGGSDSAEVAELTESLEEARQVFQLLQQESKMLREENSKLRAERDDLEMRLDNFEREQQEEDVEFSERLKAIAAQHADELQALKTKFESQLETATEDQKKTEFELEALQQENKRITEEYTELSEQLDTTLSLMGTIEEKLDDLEVDKDFGVIDRIEFLKIRLAAFDGHAPGDN